MVVGDQRNHIQEHQHVIPQVNLSFSHQFINFSVTVQYTRVYRHSDQSLSSFSQVSFDCCSALSHGHSEGIAHTCIVRWPHH